MYNSFALLNRLYLTLSNHLRRFTTSGSNAHLTILLLVTYIPLPGIDLSIRRWWSELQTASLNGSYKNTNITQLDVSTEECRAVSWVMRLYAASHSADPRFAHGRGVGMEFVVKTLLTYSVSAFPYSLANFNVAETVFLSVSLEMNNSPFRT